MSLSVNEICHVDTTDQYTTYIALVEKQKGLTASHPHTQLDPFASKLTICAATRRSYNNSLQESCNCETKTEIETETKTEIETETKTKIETETEIKTSIKAPSDKIKLLQTQYQPMLLR